MAATRLYAVPLHLTHHSYCAVRSAKRGRARIGPPEALGASGETAEGCPVGARRAGASEPLWTLKPSATSLEAETFPRLLNLKPQPTGRPRQCAARPKPKHPPKNKQSNSVHPTSILTPYTGVRRCGHFSGRILLALIEIVRVRGSIAVIVPSMVILVAGLAS